MLLPQRIGLSAATVFFFSFIIAGILIGAQASHCNYSALYCLHVVYKAFWLGLDIHFHLQYLQVQ